MGLPVAPGVSVVRRSEVDVLARAALAGTGRCAEFTGKTIRSKG